jgi:GNAT superfamily N-acetyltransferase
VAELLMRHLLEWSRVRGLVRVVLHASASGRPLYEKLGFVATNEMRYTGTD